jgi:hypothetical protein
MPAASDPADAMPGDGRDETLNERSDRNWSELLQEFRVLQTGTQILAGFLLTLPFQPRFTELNGLDHVLYLVLVVLAVTVTLLALAPVIMHRLVFGRLEKPQLVRLSSRILMVCLGAASVGLWAGGAVVVVIGLVWIVGPRLIRGARDRVS